MSTVSRLAAVASVVAVVLFPAGPARADGGDWPTWRHDPAHTAASSLELPAELHLQWSRRLPPLKPAWKDPINQDRMGFDRFYEPVVSGRMLFLGSSASDKVVALDTRSGNEKWRFYADGPVRFAPAVWSGKVYFVSDDGFLYCLDAADGSLKWKFRGGPDGRKVLGNERVISAWPARGAPVVADGVVYFGASIWPFMGTFIHALDAETGKVVWTNDGTGATFMLQPHKSPAFAGPAPQGYMTVIGDKLLVSNGRSTPACFDRKTGKMLYYRLADNGKRGGAPVAAIGEVFFNWRGLGSDLYELGAGDIRIPFVGKLPVLTEQAYYFGGDWQITARSTRMKRIEYEQTIRNKRTGKTTTVQKVRWELAELWRGPGEAFGDLIKAGDRLYAGGKNVVSAVTIPADGGKSRLAWRRKVDGMVGRLVAADDRLFAVTDKGTIYCFGARRVASPQYIVEAPLRAVAAQTPAKKILKLTKAREGYCLIWGAPSGRVLEQMARNSSLTIIVVDPDADKVAALRRKLDAAGLYGSRVAVHVGDPATFRAPAYLASLTVLGDFGHASRFLKPIFHSMRPYGGLAVLELPDDMHAAMKETVAAVSLERAQLSFHGGMARIERYGPLSGAGSWTHQYGDVANTVHSQDRLVKAPLGMLWFGGPSHMDVLPRHGHGPPEQVIGGRLFIQGIDLISARDVYTGRVLWKRRLPLATRGVYWDRTYKPDPLNLSYNQVHIPGANARGTNFVATPDAVYVLAGGGCLKLDPATGKTLAEFKLPADAAGRRPTWGYIGVHHSRLIAGVEVMKFPANLELLDAKGKPRRRGPFSNYNQTTSRRLIVMNRHTGKVLWTFTPRLGLRHNAIVVGNERIYCIDMLPGPVADALRRRGEAPPHKPRLLVMDVGTGKIIWSTEKNVFGTWLSFSPSQNILIQAGRGSRDMLREEPNDRMIAYQGHSGRVLWDKSFTYEAPPMLHGGTLYTQGAAYDMSTGEPRMRRHPLTGEEIPWRLSRHYGCNTVISSVHLLTFRSAAAGFYDLTSDGGTANIGGFKSGCTSNLVVADGVLNAPDYTRTCTCSYQNQTSLALVHDPDVEMWTFSSLPAPDSRVRRIGINLGAPGDRMADGTLWLDYPSVGGPSPDVPVEVSPEEVKWFRRHGSRIAGKTPWVAASGGEGIRRLAITLAPRGSPVDRRAYTVRLHFAEPRDARAGRRVFSVSIQGKRVLKDFDVVRAAGGARRAVVKEFKGIRAGRRLAVSLEPAAGSAAPLLCGVEIVAEGW